MTARDDKLGFIHFQRFRCGFIELPRLSRERALLIESISSATLNMLGIEIKAYTI